MNYVLILIKGSSARKGFRLASLLHLPWIMIFYCPVLLVVLYVVYQHILHDDRLWMPSKSKYYISRRCDRLNSCIIFLICSMVHDMTFLIFVVDRPQRIYSSHGSVELTLTLKASLQSYCVNGTGKLDVITIWARVFNGHPVGPEIVVKKGDVVTIHFHNELGPDDSLLETPKSL